MQYKTQIRHTAQMRKPFGQSVYAYCGKTSAIIYHYHYYDNNYNNLYTHAESLSCAYFLSCPVQTLLNLISILSIVHRVIFR